MRQACFVVATLLLVTLVSGPVSGAVLIHEYELNGSFSDAFGGAALVPTRTNGLGTLTATHYTFAPGQGLSLSDALPNAGTYSILIDFSFETLAGYRKILDFADLTSDDGVYDLNTALVFYPSATGPPGAFKPKTYSRAIFTRDSSTNQFTGYVDGRRHLEFVDSTKLAVFNTPTAIMHFFNDDRTTTGETSAGAVDRIQIYDAALSSEQVAVLGQPTIPEPCSIVLTGVGVVALLTRRQRPRETSNSGTRLF